MPRRYPQNREIHFLSACLLGTFASLFSNATTQAEVTGFTEAYRSVDVASAESGIVSKVLVKVGDTVKAGQAIAELDSSVQKAQLDLARHLAESKSELVKAEAELQTRESVMEHIQRLFDENFAQEKELIRARMELEIARANVLSRQERISENEHRVKIAQLNLTRRTVYSPVAGIVSEVHHEPGEFVSPVSPHVATVIEIEPMIARFQINVLDINRFSVGQECSVKMENGRRILGQIDSIGVLADSETVTVRIQIPNVENAIRSGQRCYLRLPALQHVTKK